MGVLLLCSHDLWFLDYPWWGAGLVVCVGGVAVLRLGCSVGGGGVVGGFGKFVGGGGGAWAGVSFLVRLRASGCGFVGGGLWRGWFLWIWRSF